MDLKLIPEDNGFTTRGRKPGNETHISRNVKPEAVVKNPWRGKFDRRKIPRDEGVVFSVPLAANDGNIGKPETD